MNTGIPAFRDPQVPFNEQPATAQHLTPESFAPPKRAGLTGFDYLHIAAIIIMTVYVVALAWYVLTGDVLPVVPFEV